MPAQSDLPGLVRQCRYAAAGSAPVSMMILFLDSCSWMRMTFSVPLTTK